MVEKITVQRKWLIAYEGSIYGETSYASLGAPIITSPDYSLMDVVRMFRGMNYSLEYLLEELLKADIAALGTDYDVPVVLFSGRYDYQVPSSINEAWFNSINAPHKEYVWFEESAHMVPLSEPERFAQELVARVLPLAQADDAEETTEPNEL